MSSISRVSVIGLGYIGLPTAAILAKNNFKVQGMDVSLDVVAELNSGKIHTVEPGLQALVKSVVDSGNMTASMSVQPADVFIITVPTPFMKDHAPDMSFVHAATLSIAPVLQRGNLVILESTVPVGSTKQLATTLAAQRPDLTFPGEHGESADVLVAFCPERVLPGQILRELRENDRIIGGLSMRSCEETVNLYRTFCNGKLHTTDAQTAEMAKLTENSFRDVNIAFANELSMICDRLGIQVWDLIRLANCHPRVKILNPGPGVGGHCIAVDPWFIVQKTPEEARLIRTAREVNDSKPEWVVRQIQDCVHKVLAESPGKRPEDVTIACLGLSFKPDIEDLRESPALQVARRLAVEHPGRVLAVEPYIREIQNPGRIELVEFAQAEQDSDIGVLLVDHSSFSRRMPRFRYVVDTKGFWTSAAGGDQAYESEKVGPLKVRVYRSKAEAVDSIIDATGAIRTGFAVSVNPEIIVQAHIDPDYMRILKQATHLYADSIGMAWLLRKKGHAGAPRIPGCELWEALMKRAGECAIPVFLVGAAPGVAKATAEKLQQNYGTVISGHCHGYFQDPEAVFQQIKESGARIVAVAMGVPNQEKFIDYCYSRHPATFYLGVGGSFDVYSGRVKRAPAWVRYINLEFLYRILAEPRRVIRCMALPRFMGLVYKGQI